MIVKSKDITAAPATSHDASLSPSLPASSQKTTKAAAITPTEEDRLAGTGHWDECCPSLPDPRGDHIQTAPQGRTYNTRTPHQSRTLQQKFSEAHASSDPVASHPLRLDAHDLDGDVLDRNMELIESISDVEGLDSSLTLTGGSESKTSRKRAKDETVTGGPQQWKRNSRKQFSENPDLYLRPYLDACVFIDKIETAQAMLQVFEKLNSGASVEDYNTIIHAYARKGQWDGVRHLLARMVSKNVASNSQTYAASLECLARCPETDLNIVSKGLEQMERESITLEEVLSEGSFSGDGRRLVIGLIQKVLPDFKVPPPPERLQCRTGIVRDLYEGSSAGMTSGGDQSMSFSELFDKEEVERRFQQQWAMELAETVTVTSVEETGDPDAMTVQRRKLLDRHRVQWRMSLKRAMENEITRQKFKFKNPNIGSMCFYPFLKLLPVDDYVEMMLQALSTVAATMEGSMTVVLARDLGSRLFRKYGIRSKLQLGSSEQTKELYKKYVETTCEHQDEGGVRLPREHFHQLEDEMLGSSSLEKGFQAKPWPPGLLFGIGTLLADMMLREIKIDSNMHNSKPEKQWIPALYHMYTYRSFKHVGFIKPHPTLVDLIQTAKDPNLEFDSNMLPMVTPPLPWTSVKFGAYPLSSTKIMRCKDGAHQHQLLLEKTNSAELYPILDSLNQLSAVPWIINKPVLDTVISVFRNNGSKELDIPQPASVCPVPQRITSDMTREEMAQVHRERAISRKLQAEMHSLRMDMLYKLSVANKYRDEIFWFPHNMDFRGRVYPCPPHFNHFGNDVTRSILLFARGRPLGEEGFRWLKIHLVNLTGKKKRCSVAERLQYANDMMPEILDSADRPLDGNGWWRESDEPWQTLASCMEVAAATRSGDPAQYVSHLPIHQDGSCNGLQHYAALGRDLIGAQQVNLHPSDIPQDVYSGVAQMVEELRAQDAAKGNRTAQALDGHVKRNVVKQPVMTVVYGVTSYGSRRQILKQLRDEKSLSEDEKWYAAGYLTIKVFQSLRKMFTKTREIQDWLTESAWLISKAGETVEWVTPLGLPIVQPYHKRSLKVVNHGGRNVYHEERHSQSERPDTMKQKNAFPPNFIHSLDSTHMMLTSLYSQRAGITFASVHDCYWTHASTVNEMNKICRSQFVKLHKEPILDNLAEFLIDKYGELDIVDTNKLKRGSRNMKMVSDYVSNVPEKGEFDLDNVLRSTYFFS
ncbi:DNA-directed RNA polymerase, mitochondrial-like [Diadema antillarum]|uniref:DNA-directed RNA polymerase, mitochondrial-like n=1 Tax=Diadema antillarum TaxID=105358 RepID=UPI003A8A9569